MMDCLERRDEKSELIATNTSLPWARFSAWLECVCVVTFDLELGQAIEVKSVLFSHLLCFVVMLPASHVNS